MSKILRVPYIRQLDDGYCLPACAQMVLAYWGITRDQVELAKQLKMKPRAGTASSHIRLLASKKVEVTYGSGELADLRDALNKGVPPIAMVDTGELPYWEIATTHAVVLLAMDEKTVLLNDPDKEEAPIRVTLGDFELAWYEMDNRYALLKKKPIWKLWSPFPFTSF